MSLDTKFSDMPSAVRQNWLDWARSHDWGHEANYHPERGIYGVEDWYSYRIADDLPVVAVLDGYKDFSTPRQMRDWAGY